MSTSPAGARSASREATRVISPCPGRKASIEPRSSAQRAQNGAGHRVFDALIGVAAEIARLDVKGAALALDDRRRRAHQRRDARAVERRRHGDEAQIVAQSRLRVERQREAEIGVERALVIFVEEHAGDALERWDRRGSCARTRPR